MAEQLLNRAIELAKIGKKTDARGLLALYLREDPSSEIAWLWFADTLTSVPERIEALMTCLLFAPGAENAQKGLELLRLQYPGIESKIAKEMSDRDKFQILKELLDSAIPEEPPTRPVERKQPAAKPVEDPTAGKPGNAEMADELLQPKFFEDDWTPPVKQVKKVSPFLIGLLVLFGIILLGGVVIGFDLIPGSRGLITAFLPPTNTPTPVPPTNTPIVFPPTWTPTPAGTATPQPLSSPTLLAPTATSIDSSQTSSGMPILAPENINELKKILENENASRPDEIIFSPDGRFLVIGFQNGSILFWSVSSRQELGTLKQDGEVVSLAISPDASLLVTGSKTGTVLVWDIRTGQAKYTLEDHTGRISAVAFSPDGTLLASGSTDQTVDLWNVETGKRTQQLKLVDEGATCLAFSPDGKLLATGTSTGAVRFWDVVNGEPLTYDVGSLDSIDSVAFSPDGTQLAYSGTRDSVGAAIRLISLNEEDKIINTMTGQRIQKVLLQFTPDGRMLISTGLSDGKGAIKFWFAVSGIEISAIPGDDVYSMALSPAGDLFVLGLTNGTQQLWTIQR